MNSERKIRDRLIATLENSPERLLVGTIADLCIRVRSIVATPGISSDDVARQLMCINEVILVLSSQLASLQRAEVGYPNDALLESLAHKGETCGCSGHLGASFLTVLEYL